jgi:hypothetical protein
VLARELNAYDVLVADHLVFTKDTLPTAAPPSGVTETPVEVVSDARTTDDGAGGEEE